MSKLSDLEPMIMDCWSVCNDLQTLFKQVGNSDRELTPDELINILLGMDELYQMKFDQLFNMYQELLRG